MSSLLIFTYANTVENIRHQVMGLWLFTIFLVGPHVLQQTEDSKIHQQFSNHHHTVHNNKGYHKHLILIEIQMNLEPNFKLLIVKLVTYLKPVGAKDPPQPGPDCVVRQDSQVGI